MGWKCGKNNVIKISRQPSLIQIVVDQKQQENVDYFNYLSSIVTDDTRFKRVLNPGLPRKKNFQKEEYSCHHQSGPNLRKNLVKYYIWSRALYGAKIWTFRKVDQKYLESSEIWCWRRMEISCTYLARNELLHKVDEETNILLTIKRRKATELVTSCVGTTF